MPSPEEIRAKTNGELFDLLEELGQVDQDYVSKTEWGKVVADSQTIQQELLQRLEKPDAVTVVLLIVSREAEPLSLWAVYEGHLDLQSAVDRAKDEWKVLMKEKNPGTHTEALLRVLLEQRAIQFISSHAEVTR